MTARRIVVTIAFVVMMAAIIAIVVALRHLGFYEWVDG